MRYVRYAGSRLGSGTLAAHAEHRLMLLGSPPDMVHGSTLRKTGSSTLLTGVRRHIAHPRSGIRPCYSGLQVKGTAGSPTSAALSKATLVFYYTRKELSTGRFVNDFFLFTKDGFVCIILKHSKIPYGPVAQLGARSVRIREVEGSNPFRSTKRNGHPSGWPFLLEILGKRDSKGGYWRHAGGMPQPPWTRAAARANPFRSTKRIKQQ
jgi:hypothetical protein